MHAAAAREWHSFWPMLAPGGPQDAPSPADFGGAAADDGDPALVAAACAGDDDAFAALVRAHKGRIFRLAARFAKDGHELDDLCQEIFIQAHRKLGAFRGESPFGHWLARIAVRKCYDLLRSRRRERAANVSSLEAAHDFLEDGAPGRAASARQAREVLQLAMTALSAEERLVLTLLELEERPVREISSLTGGARRTSAPAPAAPAWL